MTALNLYKFAGALSLPFLVAGFVWRSLDQKAYRQRLHERLGLISKAQKDGILIHGASVGEIVSLRPFIKEALEQFPNSPITVTTFTPTGSDRVLNTFDDQVQHFYLPIDTPISTNLFIQKLRPKVVVIMETEIWPALIDSCHRRGIKILLINGRISNRSYPRYKKVDALIAPTLKKVDYIFTQSKDDEERFATLGANTEHLRTNGNIKYDITIPEPIKAPSTDLRMLSLQRKVWVVGSSHGDEEALILACFKRLQEAIPGIILVIAPRHPERVKHLIELADSMGLSTVCRSQQTRPSKNDDIWLVDTMGELLNFYQIADVCTVAGSFGETGGHNPLEPAIHKRPIVVGTNTENFNDITNELLKADGIVQLEDNSIEHLFEAVLQLFEEPEAAESLGEKAFQVLEKNQGATLSAFEKLRELFEQE